AAQRTAAERWHPDAGLGVASEDVVFLGEVVVDLHISLVVEEVDAGAEEEIVSRQDAGVGLRISRKIQYVLRNRTDSADRNLVVQEGRIAVCRIHQLVNGQTGDRIGVVTNSGGKAARAKR